jgi:hypothetical protein
LILVRVDGARRLYGIDRNGIDALRNWLDGFWDETLAAFKQAAELEAAKEPLGRTNDRFERKTNGRRRSLPK